MTLRITVTREKIDAADVRQDSATRADYDGKTVHRSWKLRSAGMPIDPYAGSYSSPAGTARKS